MLIRDAKLVLNSCGDISRSELTVVGRSYERFETVKEFYVELDNIMCYFSIIEVSLTEDMYEYTLLITEAVKTSSGDFVDLANFDLRDFINKELR